MYRVYDKIEKRWVEKGIYLSPSPYDDLYVEKKSIFGKKLELVIDDRYVTHNDIGLYDRDSNLVFEGDYIKASVAENKTIIGIVTYAVELSAYIILCDNSSEYYTLGSQVCEYIEVVGNVFDGYDEK